MSKPMKILVAVFGVVMLAAVVLTMLGKPPNLPLGPLQGILAKDTATDSSVDAAASSPTTTLPDCPPGSDSTTPSGTGTGTGAGTSTDSGTGTTTGTTTDATPTAPVANGGGWHDGSRITAAGATAYDPALVRDATVVAAGATTPAAPSTPVAPAADGGATPSTGTGTAPTAADPNATTGTPATGTGAATTSNTPTVVDPCADQAAAGSRTGGTGTGATATTPSTGTGTGTGAGAATGTATGTGTASAATKSTSNGTDSGNNPEALRAASDATAVMRKAQIQVSTTGTLLPSTGGVGKPATMRVYRAKVTAAALVIKLDAAAQQQWTSAGAGVQKQLVQSFLTRLGKTYRRATRSVSVVDSSGAVLAVGDAAPAGKPAVTLF